MKDTKFRILLDIHEVRSQVTIPVKVGDVSCKIYITLVEGGKPYKIHENSFGVFTGKKGDDNYLFNNCVIENGVIRYDFTPQTVAASGILECEVRIYDEDGGVLTTPSFTIVVDERAVKDSDLASGTEFTFLDEIIVNEGQRMENERNRIEAFNNMELTVEDKGDNYLLTKTNKDGSKEEFPIGKGEDYEITPEDYQAIADKVVKDNLDSQAEEYFENLDARATEFLEDVKNQNKDYIEEATEFTSSASGKAITIESANAPLQALKLYGKTTQDGTPTPTEPIPLVSVGDSGSFEVGVYGKNFLNVNATTQTVNGVTFTVNADKSITVNGTATANVFFDLGMVKNKLLRSKLILKCGVGGNWDTIIFYMPSYDATGEVGACTDWNGTGAKVNLKGETGWARIFVKSGYTVNNKTFYPMLYHESLTDITYEPYKAKQTLTLTDTLRGVGGVADEKDFARGVKIQRFNVVDLGTLTWGKDKEGVIATNSLVSKAQPVANNGTLANMLCSAYQTDTADNTWNGVTDKTISMSNTGFLRVRDNNITDYTTLATQMSGKYLIYPLATPIETPISESELNAYRQLYTNKGNTTILSEAIAEVDYYINKPNAQAVGNIHSQVNKDYFKLQQAIISTGGN